MSTAIKQTIIVIDPNEEEFTENSGGLSDVLERFTDWIVIAGPEECSVFEWDDDLRVNKIDCTFEEAELEISHIGQEVRR